MANDRQRFDDPPPGFVVLSEVELDPQEGRPGRWCCRGIVEGKSHIRAGLWSYSAACRAAWFIYDDAFTATGAAPEVTDVASVDNAVADALARRHAIHRERNIETTDMRERHSVTLDSWAHMEAQLLAQILADAGSIRRAAKAIDVPRSTLGAWVIRHRKQGTWPT